MYQPQNHQQKNKFSIKRLVDKKEIILKAKLVFVR